MPKCKFCKKPDAKFKPVGKLSSYCDFDCFNGQALKEAEKAKKRREKEERKDNKAAKELLNQTISHWRPKADKAFQLFCRLRDKGKPCISCGKYDHELKDVERFKWHGGHYRSKGAHGSDAVRYCEDNCHAQCARCNIRLSGNVTDYRIGLIKRIGIERVQAVEDCRISMKMRWNDYKAVYEWYNRLNKILKKELEENQCTTV